MKILKKLFKSVLILIVVMVLGFIGLIVYAVISDYKPEEKEVISQTDKPSVLRDSLSFTLLTWNIGYAGLDKDMDFFYDGGTKVITPEKNCSENISGIGDFLKRNDTIDFFFIQEIDKRLRLLRADVPGRRVRQHAGGFSDKIHTECDLFIIKRQFKVRGLKRPTARIKF